MRLNVIGALMVVILGHAAMGAITAPAGKKEAAATNTVSKFEPGKTSAEIKVAGSSQWSYFVYVPKSYTADRKWPVMFIMSPGGGDAGTLDRYLAGAELNGWILAGSVQSRNDFKPSEEAVKAMVADVCKHMPVDTKRMYASGFSGGARMAFWLSEEMKAKGFAGVLPCGAGGHPDRMSPKTIVFGLCGSNCFNRWDMACTLRGIKNGLSRLRFFQGNHDWAEAEHITYAMAWLNACYLKTAPATTTVLMDEKKQLMTKIHAEIDKDSGANPERAYDWAACQGIMSALTGSQPTQALLKNPKVQLYVAGLKDMDLFVRKHFATNVMDYQNNNGPPAAKREADRLAQKYAETGLAALFTKMGEASVKP